MTFDPHHFPVAGSDDEHGEVFTRRWVVELILDLAGYSADRDLGSMRAVEPSCGAGAFLGPMVDRLLTSCALHGRDLSEASQALRAFDLLDTNVELARKTVVAELTRAGLCVDEAGALASNWVTTGDFLLAPHDEQSVDFVLGNPPYIRLEDVAAENRIAYRNACPTMRGRSDIFVGFIEMGLRLLRRNGVLGFIVADRWMRNQYGAALRSFVSEAFSVDAIIEMHDVDAFEEKVSAYPAVTVIRRSSQTESLVALTTGGFGEAEAEQLTSWASKENAEPLLLDSVKAARLPRWFSGGGSWPSANPAQLAVLADLEQRFPPLEDSTTGTRISIGLATGADDIFLTRDVSLVEPDRLLPMVMARDVADGNVNWSGTYLVNPWDDEGLVDIDQWPLFRSYLERHSNQVKDRHTARKSPLRWWKTIDRMTPGLLKKPKLLLPEMKVAIHPVLDEGNYYPHHNLYYVTSTGWDLDVLGGILLSEIANLFVGAYCVKMRGGTYRFQAQYLRRIRVPSPTSLTRADRTQLASAFERRDVEAATAAAARIYGVDLRAFSAADNPKDGRP